MSVTTADAAGPARDRDPAVPNAPPLRSAARHPAPGKASMRREQADRRAIERGEDEGLAVDTE